ncbi:hypothetical protein [Candidatus Parabeggiatoa sp. HSG14]|uniref:hypothetical protein n=1 Tax=Candidatus Parabeggiatoa sp. HSG14 TaxID=3055593 RepID=UPI0025A72D4E|nr:hypothetical protein [Thiotrichales bacterium HSG14]
MNSITLTDPSRLVLSQKRADDILRIHVTLPRGKRNPAYHVTARGQRLLNLLSIDTTGKAEEAISAFIGHPELSNTLNDLLACQNGQYKEIRTVTVERGLISHGQGGAV